jgi:plastocyanin
MKRRDFVGIGIGSAAVLAAAGGLSAGKDKEHDRDDGHHGHRPIDGQLSSATVSFGAWSATNPEPLDRTVLPTAPVAPNVHLLIPHTVTIKEGGSVNYIIAGFHQIAVYAPGTKPEDISTAVLIPIPGAPPEVGIIDDPENRIYRGLNPLTVPQDRVEVVHFGKRGVYLVICTVSPHFAENMYGWVKVVR